MPWQDSSPPLNCTPVLLCTPHQNTHLPVRQNQGMKINLSLTEMSQFFMKMAEAVKKKKLKPGASIPGCNSYFLCKFLKDTMLQARYIRSTQHQMHCNSCFQPPHLSLARNSPQLGAVHCSMVETTRGITAVVS